MAKNLVIFFDPLGRTIIGELIEKSPTHLRVQNPAVLHSGLDQGGKIQVNLIPALFREFLKDWNQVIIMDYNIDTIAIESNDIKLDDKLVAQYDSMWVERPSREEVRKAAEAKRAAATPKVIAAPAEPAQPVEKLNLFDEVKTESK